MNHTTVEGNSIPEEILEAIVQAVVTKEYGSVEIYIESGRVVQITERVIRKTDRIVNHNPSVRLYNSSNKR